MNTIPNIYQICRTCTAPSTIVYPIYGSYNIDQVLSSMFHMDITPDDALPKVICGPCFRTIVNTAMIQQKFKAAEHHLRQNLPQTSYHLNRELERQISIKIIEPPTTTTTNDGQKVPTTREPRGKYTCKPCRKSFMDKRLHFRHMRLLHAKSDYACDVCHEDFDSRYRLGMHKSTAHWNDFPYKCDYCPSKFKQFTILKRHILNQHDRVVMGEIDY